MRNQILSVKGKASPVTIPSHRHWLRLFKCSRGKRIASTNISTTTTVVSWNVQLQVRSVKSRPLPYQNTSLKKTSVAVSRGNENKQELPPSPPPPLPPTKTPAENLLILPFHLGKKPSRLPYTKFLLLLPLTPKNNNFHVITQ